MCCSKSKELGFMYLFWQEILLRLIYTTFQRYSTWRRRGSFFKDIHSLLHSTLCLGLFWVKNLLINYIYCSWVTFSCKNCCNSRIILEVLPKFLLSIHVGKLQLFIKYKFYTKNRFDKYRFQLEIQIMNWVIYIWNETIKIR